MRTAVFAAAVLFGVVGSAAAQGRAARVEVVRKDADRRVDVLVDGKPFTLVHLAHDPEEAGAVSDPHRDGARRSRAGFRSSRGRASGWITRTTWDSGSTTAT